MHVLGRRVDEAFRDWWPVVLVAALALVSVSPQGSVVPGLVSVVLGLGAAVLLRWRRERPVAVIVGMSSVLGLLVVTGAQNPSFAWFASLLLGCFALGQHATLRPALAGLLAPVLVVGLLFLAAPAARPEELVFPLFYLGGAWGVGRVVRRRQELVGELASAVEELERERDENSALAAEAERQRIAREVHDVVAHSLGIILMHAEAAEEVLDRRGADVRRPLSVIQSTARESLEEIRAVLGAIRTDSAVLDPSLEAVPALVQRFRSAGVDIELQVCGSPEGEHVPPPVQAVAYRVVQEALTNVLRHARGSNVVVRIHPDAGGLEVSVRDDGQGRSPRTQRLSGPGYGLAGMQERVARLGGDLTTGHVEGGGFAVHARLPLHGTLQ